MSVDVVILKVVTPIVHNGHYFDPGTRIWLTPEEAAQKIAEGPRAS